MARRKIHGRGDPMHEEISLDQAFDLFHLSNRNETDCCGGQETGRHAHGSPVTNAATVAHAANP